MSEKAKEGEGKVERGVDNRWRERENSGDGLRRRWGEGEEGVREMRKKGKGGK